MRIIGVATFALLVTGCMALAQGVPAMTSAFVGGAGAPGADYLIFGGPGHETYLGCLSCPASDSESALNEYGTYGSPYSSTSIANPYSKFGSPYSSYSACNPHASDPPVVVDRQGSYYGRLTMNEYNRDQIEGPNTLAWLRSVCEG